MDKLKNPTIVFNLPKLIILYQPIETNMDGKDLLKYGLSIKNIDSEKIEFVTIRELPRYEGVSYFIYDENKMKKLLQC